MRVGKRHPLYTAKREIRRRGITCSFWTARPGSGSSRHPGGSLGGTTYGWKVPPIWENQQKYGYPIHQTMPRIASRASFRPYQITFQDSFGLYQITFQTTYYIPPGDCRRRTAWLIFFILKKTHPSLLFMSMSWIGKNLQLAHLETQLASLRC